MPTVIASSHRIMVAVLAFLHFASHSSLPTTVREAIGGKMCNCSYQRRDITEANHDGSMGFCTSFADLLDYKVSANLSSHHCAAWVKRASYVLPDSSILCARAAIVRFPAYRVLTDDAGNGNV